ncbi:MAG: universal stress protein [Edaphobacter sp.]|uniref:universal stress protein n=1 Tax=Edaphobacter sp. TaxID=1934404 RepID=UPI002395400C|nr:universal stress protein [Edaphobacter sp.]MDE1177140.1 universal stress protein [Edaphobacter sp.]
MPAISRQKAVAIDRIVMATNLASNSLPMLSYTRALAVHFSARVDVLHVADLSLLARAAEGLSAPALDSILIQNRDLLCEAARRMQGIHAECVEIRGWDRSQAILDYADQVKAGLIVMGTSGRQGLTKIVFGSTAEAVFRHARCPVLTVGPKVKPLLEGELMNSILCAADFSAESVRAVGAALAFAEKQHARLYVCHVVKAKEEKLSRPDEEWRTELQRMIPASAYAWCSPSCVVEHGEAANVLLELAEKIHAQLIVLGSRKERFGQMLMQTGLTPALLAKATCAVLTIS